MLAHALGERRTAAELAQAIVATVVYSDVFDYPLTPAELHRYLVGVAASPGQVAALLEGSPEVRRHLARRDGYLLLAGREEIVATRRRRAAVAARLWPLARRYGALIARMPFVRMVALTGALAMDNVDEGADIDFIVITEPGRLWVCRLLAIALVRAAALRGDVVCPNYFLAETALALADHSLYAAHELTQMQPLAGAETYAAMRRLNAWADALLPNAAGPPQVLGSGRTAWRGRRLVEAALRSRVGERVEHWEMARKVRKLTRQGINTETAFSAEWCKGHFDGHGQWVMRGYEARLRALGLD
jgi:hypothetical protein